MKFVRILAWLVLPFVMLPIQWRSLSWAWRLPAIPWAWLALSSWLAVVLGAPAGSEAVVWLTLMTLLFAMGALLVTLVRLARDGAAARAKTGRVFGGQGKSPTAPTPRGVARSRADVLSPPGRVEPKPARLLLRLRWRQLGIRTLTSRGLPQNHVGAVQAVNDRLSSLRVHYLRHAELWDSCGGAPPRRYAQQAMAQWRGVLRAVAGLARETSPEMQGLRARTRLARLDHVDGVEFENVCAQVLRRKGYSVDTTRASGDYGADLILHSKERTTVVQCKRYQGHVGVRAVQEVAAARSYYQANEAWVVTNSYFTRNAVSLAERTNVWLVNRDALLDLIRGTVGDEDESVARCVAAIDVGLKGVADTVAQWSAYVQGVLSAEKTAEADESVQG
jgi:Holliday junction resolvase-like predicted endonuclease